MIELKNVSYAYESIPALKDVSFTINNGDCVAIKGQNGSGKSTLLKLLNGIIFATTGEYIFEDIIINKETMKRISFPKAFHQKIGFVFQNPDSQLFCNNVYDEIAFGPRQMGFSEEIVNKRTQDCLKLLDIEKLKDRAPYHLSGGEKRKVAIASVLSLNPSVLMLDEPLNGLDNKSQKWFIDFLLYLKQSNKTIVLSTHDDILCNTICEKIITL